MWRCRLLAVRLTGLDLVQAQGLTIAMEDHGARPPLTVIDGFIGRDHPLDVGAAARHPYGEHRRETIQGP